MNKFMADLVQIYDATLIRRTSIKVPVMCPFMSSVLVGGVSLPDVEFPPPLTAPCR